MKPQKKSKLKTFKNHVDNIEREIISKIGKTLNTSLYLINHKPNIKHSLAIINLYHRRRINKPHQVNYNYLKGVQQIALNHSCSC